MPLIRQHLGCISLYKWKIKEVLKPVEEEQLLASEINQRNEPHHEKEHVKISNAAKFQSCRPNTREMVGI